MCSLNGTNFQRSRKYQYSWPFNDVKKGFCRPCLHTCSSFHTFYVHYGASVINSKESLLLVRILEGSLTTKKVKREGEGETETMRAKKSCRSYPGNYIYIL